MSKAAAGPANRLASEPSPYLRQHAHNPVDWWPWGEAAFAEARRRNVPVFLSIGYATCHWCHVMAHESFEDAEVARRMNEAFVCIKVDREERPDVDGVYMAVCQSMTGSGGWPLTVVLTPNKKPFFAGTYFPKESRHGRIGMMDLVPRLQQGWATQAASLEKQGEHILQHVRGEPHAHEDHGEAAEQSTALSEVAPDELGVVTLEAGAAALGKRFDAKHGGFGGQPKFPSAQNLLFLLRQAKRSNDSKTVAMVRAQLDAMAAGGIHDHLGGGFHRYSTDAEWLVPHFEKMLYDQAMLAFAYTEAFLHTREPRYERIARTTLDYVLRDLSDPAGGFRCAEDADSEGEEGKFYVWRREEVQSALGKEGLAFANAYGLSAQGNYLDEATRKRTGTNILHLPDPLPEKEVAAFASGRAKLLALRSRRIRPQLDDKVLTDWNGLALAAFSLAARVFAEPRYEAAATRCANFLRKSMRRPDGRLRHRFHHGITDDVSFLDDHAYLLWGLLELYGTTFDPAYLTWAREVAQQVKARFADSKTGGFFETPLDGEDLGARRKEAYDGALPSGNNVAAWCLHRLALLTGEPSWGTLADKAMAAFAPQIAAHPHGFPMALIALDLAVGPTREVVIAADGAQGKPMLDALAKKFLPRTVVLATRPGLAAVAPWTLEHKPIAGKPAAYVCEGQACKAPTTDLAGLTAQL